MRRILVPVDFSPCSQAALEYAAYFASCFGAAIDLLHVWEGLRAVDAREDVGRDATPLYRFAHCEAGHEMDSFLALLEERGLRLCQGRLECGAPAETIIDVATLDEYDLIVMGTHGRGRPRFFSGSVAEKVVRGAPCPVLTVHPAPVAPSVRPDSAGRTGRTDGAERT